MSSGARSRHPVPFAVGAVALLFAVALAFRWWAERRIIGPWYVDEFVYAQSAREIAADWWRLVREFAAHFYLYPRLIAPAWAADSMPTTYAVAKAINVILITSAAVPLYLWARRVLSQWWSALVVALALALPTGLYSGVLVTENAFFPAFVLASFLIASALERPTPLRQALAIAAVGLACAVRLQGIIFLAIIPSAVVMKAVFDMRQTGERMSWRRLAAHVRPYLLLLGLLVAGLALYALRQLLVGGTASGGLGIYAPAVNLHYSAAQVLKWIAYHFAGIAVAVTIIPLGALVLLIAEAWRRDCGMTSAERAFIAVVTPAFFWLVVQVGIFASRRAERISERYMFHAEALLLLALVVWVHRGAPRPRRALVLAVAAPLALVLTLPLHRLLTNQGIFSETFSLVALNRLSQHVGGIDGLRIVLAVAAVAAAVIVGLAPRRIVIVLAPGLVLAYLIAASLAVPGALRAYANGVRAGAQIGEPANWIDRAAGRSSRVDLLYTGDPEPDRERMTILQTQFWNRSVRILDLLTPFSGLCCVPRRIASTDPSSGLVRPDGGPVVPAAFVVALPPLGEIAATKGAQAGPLALVRPTSPLRLLSSTAGVYSDGWTSAFATYDRFDRGSAASRVRIVVSRAAWTGPDVPGTVRMEVGPLAKVRGSLRLARVVERRTWTVHSGSTRTFVLDAPRPPYRVAVHVEPTFSPSAFGLSDSRQLGAQVAFRPAIAKN